MVSISALVHGFVDERLILISPSVSEQSTPGVARLAAEPLDRLDRVLDFRRALEAMRDEAAPFLEIVRAPEGDRVVLHGLPLHEQAVAARLFHGALQLEGPAPFGALEERRRLGDPGLELRLEPGLHVDLRNLGHHPRRSSVGSLDFTAPARAPSNARSRLPATTRKRCRCAALPA